MLNNNLCLFLNEASSAPKKKKEKKNEASFPLLLALEATSVRLLEIKHIYFMKLEMSLAEVSILAQMLKQRTIRETHVDLEYGDENEKYSANISFPQIWYVRTSTNC